MFVASAGESKRVIGRRYNRSMLDPWMDAKLNQERDRHYCAVGRVAVTWSRLEGYLREMIQMLATEEIEPGELITARIPAENLTDILSALCEFRCPGKTKEASFKETLNRIGFLAEKRDQMVNDIWTFDPGIINR